MTNENKQFRIISCLFLMMFFSVFAVSAQNVAISLRGKVSDVNGVPIIGATVAVKNGTEKAITDVNGDFTLKTSNGAATVVVSYIGMITKTVAINGNTTINITLEADDQQLKEVVVVGYGTQKKESLVGAIAQTTGKVLERTGGVTNLGQALTGNLPGVVTTSSSGMPGAEDPQILIRGQTSWNNSSPLILVDGVERSISSIDISSVESISVLKDASATAVFGVKGANGVILVTTKQGKKGKADIRIRSNMTTKVASQLPEKYDSYDALSLVNETIARELLISSSGWANYKPEDILLKYRYPANDEERDRYPNVDWEDALFKNSTQSYNTSASVSGGSDFVSYFANADFTKEGDLFRTFDNDRGYEAGYGYTRANVRSNLDFNLTKTTKFSTKLFGSSGVRKVPWNAEDDDASFWASAYRTSPDAMQPVYSDGIYGFYAPADADVPNSVFRLANSGEEKRTTNQITTNFTLQQNLDVILKGLDFRTNLSMDYTFAETQRGVNDLYNDPFREWVDPETGIVVYPSTQTINAGTRLDYTDGVRWSTESGSVDAGKTYRRMNYSFQLNYDRQFGKHAVTAMGTMLREKLATGSEFPRYREDWVFRSTYNYASKYFFEVNGAYNGSEQFGPDYRFAFFPSFAAGWLLSNENFLKDIDFLSNLKVRGSWGRIGDDRVSNSRFLYQDQWAYGGNTLMGANPASSPYTYYDITALGNPDISWETVEKRNLGIDYGFLNGKISGSVDIFKDHRTDVLISNGRAIPTYFGVTAPAANLGEVKSKGYEIELNLNHTLGNGLHLWFSGSMTHAENEVIFRDDPELYPDYQKQAGYAIGQTRSYLDEGYLQSWDDVYGSTQRSTYNESKLPGDYNIIDFNGDGVIDSYDSAPYDYSTTPQNTYNASLGFDWKGFNVFVQFYGVNNVTREVTFPTFFKSSHVAYVEGTYWTVSEGGDVPYPRIFTTVGGDASGTRYQYDGSYMRLKNAEIGYTFTGKNISKLGVKSCKIYANGNNLFLWTKMPDDRESNFSGNSSFGAYPTMKRFNLGLDITL